MAKINKLAIAIADIDQIDEEPRYGYTSQQIRNLKEAVKRDLSKKNRSIKGWILDWAISIFNRDLLNHRLRRLRYFKSASDELPQELVQGHYKCRGNYIVGLRLTLQAMIKEGIITDSSILEKITKYRAYDFTFYHGYGKRTTQVEIDFINETLDMVIRYLEELDRQAKSKTGEPK